VVGVWVVLGVIWGRVVYWWVIVGIHGVKGERGGKVGSNGLMRSGRDSERRRGRVKGGRED
jgi:hypothetical protein